MIKVFSRLIFVSSVVVVVVVVVDGVGFVIVGAVQIFLSSRIFPSS